MNLIHRSRNGKVFVNDEYFVVDGEVHFIPEYDEIPGDEVVFFAHPILDGWEGYHPIKHIIDVPDNAEVFVHIVGKDIPRFHGKLKDVPWDVFENYLKDILPNNIHPFTRMLEIIVPVSELAKPPC